MRTLNVRNGLNVEYVHETKYVSTSWALHARTWVSLKRALALHAQLLYQMHSTQIGLTRQDLVIPQKGPGLTRPMFIHHSLNFFIHGKALHAWIWLSPEGPRPYTPNGKTCCVDVRAHTHGSSRQPMSAVYRSPFIWLLRPPVGPHSPDRSHKAKKCIKL